MYRQLICVIFLNTVLWVVGNDKGLSKDFQEMLKNAFSFLFFFFLILWKHLFPFHKLFIILKSKSKLLPVHPRP